MNNISIDSKGYYENQCQAPPHTMISNQSPMKFNRAMLRKDFSFHPNGISRGASIESMLESRKPDPEEVLIGLGFGPAHNSSMASRIPQRFLQPSKLLSNIDINTFLEQFEEVRGPEYRFSLPNSPSRLQHKSLLHSQNTLTQ